MSDWSLDRVGFSFAAGELFWSCVLGEVRFRRTRESAALTSTELAVAAEVDSMLQSALLWGDRRALKLARALLPPPLTEQQDTRSSLDWADWAALDELRYALRDELTSGRIRVELRRIQALQERPFEVPKLDRAPRPVEDSSMLFEVRLVDEIGQAIPGVPVEFDLSQGELTEISTNAAGVALLERTQASSAKVRVKDVPTLKRILDPRWETPRSGNPPRVGHMTTLSFEEEPLGPIAIKAAVPNTVVLTPPALLFVDVLDRYGDEDANQAAELQVQNQSGETVAKFPRSEAVSSNNALRFALNVDSLPSPASFVVRRGDLLEPHGVTFEPKTLRDELQSQRLAQASLLVGEAVEDGRVAGPGGTSSGRGAPQVAASDLRVAVNFENSKHRFLKLASVTLKGAALVPDSVQGRHLFDVNPGATQVELEVRIPPQAPGAQRDILLLRQIFDVHQNGPGRSIIESGKRHPRLRSISFNNRKLGTMVVELDLRFLDVTDHVRNTAYHFRAFEREPSAGCNTVILEETTTDPAKPEGAFTWAVTLPPAVQRSKGHQHNLLLFFRMSWSTTRLTRPSPREKTM